MPNDWNIGLAGQQGQPGVPGPAGGVFVDAPSDSFYYGRTNATWARVLGLVGGTLTGQLNITSPATQLTLNHPTSGQPNSIYGTMNGLGRWLIQIGTASAESGSNVGSDFAIYRYNDAGTLIDGPFTITRSNGWTNISVVNTTSFQNNPTFAGSIVVNGNTTLQNVWINGSVQTNVTFAAGVWFNGATYQQYYGFIYNGIGGTNQIGFIWASPYVYAYVDGGQVYGIAPSDERLKQDITPTTHDCLSTVAQIPLYSFRWKKSADPANIRVMEAASIDDPVVPVGFVAQRLYEVWPDSVIKGGEGEITRTYDDNPFKLWSVEHNNTIALLTGAIQQLLKRVEALEAKLP